MSTALHKYFTNVDVSERFAVSVRAPAAMVFEVAKEFDIESNLLIRVIFRTRERIMGATPIARPKQGFLADMQAMGWGCLEERPGELFVGGAACQPWKANVEFQPLSADSFAAYSEPDRVKIAWCLEVQQIDSVRSRLITETRAAATDEPARRKFRSYWRWARFGIIPIRWILLPAIRREAERRTWRKDR